MTRPPQACGLILCEGVRVDASPARFNLDGLFLGRAYAAFPTPKHGFTVYAGLFGGRGEGVLELACMELELERDIYYHKRWVAFSEPARSVHYVVPVKEMIFPNPGRYRFTMSFDHEPFAVRFLDVRKAQS
jgi:hypothetical protein